MAKYNLSLSVPNIDQDTEVEVDGLGRYKNKRTYVISEAQAATFRATRGLDVDKAFVNTAGVNVSAVDEQPAEQPQQLPSVEQPQQAESTNEGQE